MSLFLKRNLLGGILYSLLSFFPNFAEAQNPVQDTTKYTLPAIVVEERKEKTEVIPEMVLNAIAGENPNLRLYLKVPEITSLIPGVTGVYKYVPAGTIPYRNKIPFVGRNDLNYSITPTFSIFPTEQTEGVSSAITTASDIPLELRTMQIENGFFLNVQPLQLSGGAGHVSDKFSASGSIQFLDVPEFLPDNIRDPLKILGRGGRIHLLGQYGEIENNISNRSSRFSLEAYAMGIDVNFSDKSWKGIDRFEEHNRQAFIMEHSEHPIDNGILEITNSLQFGSSDSEIRKKDQNDSRTTNQEIKLFTNRSAINYPGASFGLTFHNLKKTNIFGAEKNYSIFQIFADKIFSLPLNSIGRANSRVDFIEGINGLPRFSVYGALERKIISGLTFGASAAYLQDAIISETLSSPSLEFSPSPDIEVQRIFYGEARLEARLGSHTLRFAVGKRKMNMPLFAEGAEITGSYYNASYLWSNENKFLTISATYRPMRMNLDGNTNYIPGTPRGEIKAIGGISGRNFSIGTSIVMQGSSLFLLGKRESQQEFAETGTRFLLNPYFSATYKPFSFGLTVVNTLELLENMGLIDNFSNVLAVYGKDRDVFEMPGFVYFTLEYRH